MRLRIPYLIAAPVAFVPFMLTAIPACTDDHSVSQPTDSGLMDHADASNDVRVGSCVVPADGGCWAETSPLRECVDFSTGVYGSAGYGCAAHCPPNYGGCMGGVVSTTDVASGETKRTDIRGGIFAVELAPGTYDVCYESFREQCSVNARCVRAVLTQGQLRQIAISEIGSPGGVYCNVRCDPTSDCATDASTNDQ
ncbi:hypothetical protein LZC95_27120 [Pendulispora brunnea]|uniref:Uncharacterized protein n=1 Tax=Pendulispora brunnea TaxID=2905690 RepID=A0ABZ2JUH9_9BACT